MAFARLPGPLRRVLLKLAHSIGRHRPKFFGTFAVTTPPADRLSGWLSVWTARLSYGRVDPDGTVRVNVAVDHRVVDGPTGANVLVRLEQVLNGPITEELRASAKPRT